ncbi:polyphosphate kinase 2 [Methylocella silvestris]|uniref:Polyphosphate kinase 2 n=2 Tax=Methylocella silvestris TaxID=199596 RepID=A0A2J7TKQ5_METSI|nr:polyphosphate kinase 2 [Methylocella silvestris]
MDYRKLFFVDPGRRFQLKDQDPDASPGLDSKAEGEAALAAAGEQLTHLQRLLYAEKKHGLLIVLQGMDAAGKDGSIRRAFTAFHPLGVIATSFKVPTLEEADHDFLWRVHPHAPRLGSIAIFNRSHYEDFLVNRAHRRLDDKAAALRLEQIRDFETLLAQNGVVILKFFLHISKEEQLARFKKRLRDPESNWKIEESDYTERVYWDAYMSAYEEAMAATSLPGAPWYVIPADRKWFRDVALMQITLDALKALDMKFPKPTVDLADIERRYHTAMLEQENKS